MQLPHPALLWMPLRLLALIHCMLRWLRMHLLWLLHPVLRLLHVLQPSPGKPQPQHEHLLPLLHGTALLS
jgi:hypothetical protein